MSEADHITSGEGTSSLELDEGGDGELIRIVYAGGLADAAGALLLDEYAEGINGWLKFLRLAGEPFVRSAARNSGLTRVPDLRIEVRAERRGSYEILVWLGNTVGQELAGAAALYGTVVGGKRLLNWYRTVIRGHADAKRRTVNVDEVVANLEAMANQENIDLIAERQNDEESQREESGNLLLDDTSGDAPAAERAGLSPEDLRRKLIELVDALDAALRAATRPLERSCERVGIGPVNAPVVVTLDRADRAALLRPLELPMPTRAWIPARVRFVRIHRETGEVTFRFIKPGSDKPIDGQIEGGRLLDKSALRGPNNPFTTAFNENAPLAVLVRQQIPTPGRLKPKYDIQQDAPDPDSMFPGASGDAGDGG